MRNLQNQGSFKITNSLFYYIHKQGPTQHRPMAYPVVFRYFPTPQGLQNIQFIPNDGARPSARLGHVCSCLLIYKVNESHSDRVAT